MMLDLNVPSLIPHKFYMMGGDLIWRKEYPNTNGKTREKIPFRKIQPNLVAIYKGFEKFCQAYKAVVKDIYNKGLLLYPDSTEYKKILSR
jgi:hypothetical protein